jgi:2-polyprenyl-3-methyl-5-hydroxy-6-metoxy-1,4-benzoquinol methylase
VAHLFYLMKLRVKHLFFPGINITTRKRMRLCKHFKKENIDTLDIGCGNGAFTFYAYKLGNNVLGIDYDYEKLNKCIEYRDYLKLDADHCRFMVFNIYELEKLNKKFDQVICFEVLEHLINDRDALKIIAGILKTGGVVHITTPSSSRRQAFGEKISSIENGGHVRLGYTYETLERMLNEVNLKVVVKEQAVSMLNHKIELIIGRICLMLSGMFNRNKVITDLIHVILFLIFYPLTYLNIVIPTGSFCIYVKAIKK